ncbi:unnamed protein product [Camellia sinensis]
MQIFVMQISSFSSLLGRTQISSLKMILDFYQDKSIYEAVENAFITIYVRKIPVETAKNLLYLAIDSNIGDLAVLEFIVGALVSKGDITTSTVLIDTDHCYCVILNADGRAAFPSEKTAQDCSSSDISSWKINIGSGKTEKTKDLSIIEWFEMQMKSGFGSLLSLGHSPRKTDKIHMKGPRARGEVEVAVSRVLLLPDPLFCWWLMAVACWSASIAALVADACWAVAAVMLL